MSPTCKLIVSVICLMPATAIAQPTGTAPVETFIRAGLPYFRARIDPAEIRALPGLQRVKSKDEQNNFDAKQTDAMVHFMFVDMEVFVLCVPARSKQCSIAQVRLWGVRRNAKFGLNPGATVETVKHVLGPPNVETTGELQYNGESDQVVLVLNGGRIKEIRWNFYTG
jgi:hypothetical protein